jgi:hypothetical protein
VCYSDLSHVHLRLPPDHSIGSGRWVDQEAIPSTLTNLLPKQITLSISGSLLHQHQHHHPLQCLRPSTVHEHTYYLGREDTFINTDIIINANEPRLIVSTSPTTLVSYHHVASQHSCAGGREPQIGKTPCIASHHNQTAGQQRSCAGA